jgi:broad specificity phosphatase PhoE
VTTVLLLRHAERDDGSLSEEGLKRADELAHVALKAGVTAIYTTDTERVRLTVQPVAGLLGLDPVIYGVASPEEIAELASEVQRDHAGEVVIIVGHNTTVASTIEAFGGDATRCSIGSAYDEFDDLCILTLYAPKTVQVVNLQYGVPSP